MKKVIIAAAFILGTGALHAQTATPPNPQARHMPSPEDMAKRQTERLNSMVKLSDEQSKSVYQANLDFANKLMAARQNHDQNAFKQAMEEREAQYKKILTADQYNTYSQQRHMMPRGAMRPAGAPGATPPPTQPAN